MKDINRFKKLFGIKIPCDEHFDYYISVLYRTKNYSNLNELIRLYEEAENNYEDFRKFSFKKSDEIINFLKGTSVSKRINSIPLSIVSCNNKTFKAETGKKYLSVDLVKANWQVFKLYDYDNELPISYEELLDDFKCPEILKRSKNYRQQIFGNLNSKKQQNIQANIMSKINIDLYSKGFVYKLSSIKHDEIIISDYNNDIYNYFVNIKNDIRVREYIPRNIDDIMIYDFLRIGSDEVIYKDLFGVPGNQLYYNIKKYILKEEIDLRDLYFKENNKLAIWADDIELLKVLNNFLHFGIK